MGWETLIPMVILVSASGALFPGPIFISSVLQGLKQGAKAGLMIATGHMIVELALVLVIGAGISTILFYGQVALNIVTIIGSLALMSFGSMQVIGAIRSKNNENIGSKVGLGRNSLLIGLLFTSLNPHFITWWLTIGFKLVLDAFVLASWLGILVMFFSHVWMDYAWLTFVSYTARKGGEKILKRWIKPVVIILSASLIIVGIIMLSQILIQNSS
jgi:threonine/homoserine/homoserine lactone efflux protein